MSKLIVLPQWEERGLKAVKIYSLRTLLRLRFERFGGVQEAT
jgi:hypothetical protein